MPTLFDTDTVAPHERFDFWTDSSDRAFFPCTFRRREALGFTGTVQQYLMGPLTVSRVTQRGHVRLAHLVGHRGPRPRGGAPVAAAARAHGVQPARPPDAGVGRRDGPLRHVAPVLHRDGRAVRPRRPRVLAPAARPPRPRPRLAPRDAAARRHRADPRRAVPHAAGARAGRRDGRRGGHRPRRERRLPAPRALHRRRRARAPRRRPATCSRASRSTSRSTSTTPISAPTRSPPRTSCRRAICRSCSRPTA